MSNRKPLITHTVLALGLLLSAGCTMTQWENTMLDKQEVFVLNANVEDVYYRLAEREGVAPKSQCAQQDVLRSRFHPRQGKFEHVWGGQTYAGSVTSMIISGEALDEYHTQITLTSYDPVFSSYEPMRRFVRGGDCS